MALSKISFSRKYGNLSTPLAGEDHISAMVFDVTNFPGTTSDGDVHEIFSLNDAETLGVTAYDDSGSAANYELGIPHLHISEFFRLNPGGSLFVAFADCSANWNIISDIQSLAQGKVRQAGVWTRQKLLQPGAAVSDPYELRLVADLHSKADELAKVNQPISVLLSANLVSIDAAGNTTGLTQLPDISGSSYDRVTALIGQGNSPTVKAIQLADVSHNTVGCVGAALGLVARSSVGDSIAHVAQFDMSGGHMNTVALGFGDVSITDLKLTNTYALDTMTQAQKDGIESKGYVFPMKYTGLTGTYMSSSKTVSNTDYRTIERNRVIDKSRRNMRTRLLPFLNGTVDIAPSTGTISVAQIKVYKVACESVLQNMQDAGEISGFQVRIDPAQNILLTDTLAINYIIVPNGKSANITVTEGFALTTTE